MTFRPLTYTPIWNNTQKMERHDRRYSFLPGAIWYHLNIIRLLKFKNFAQANITFNNGDTLSRCLCSARRNDEWYATPMNIKPPKAEFLLANDFLCELQNLSIDNLSIHRKRVPADSTVIGSCFQCYLAWGRCSGTSIILGQLLWAYLGSGSGCWRPLPPLLRWRLCRTVWLSSWTLNAFSLLQVEPPSVQTPEVSVGCWQARLEAKHSLDTTVSLATWRIQK